MRRAWGVVLFLYACGSADTIFPASPDAPSTMDSWKVLAQTDWTLQPHTETYLCVRATVDHDVHVGGFDPIAPLGTHHSVLGISRGTLPDGVSTCSGLFIEPSIMFGSGVGTQRLDLPAGVGTKIMKGQQVVLNLHLYNTGDAPLSGTSGVRVKEMEPAAVVNEADAMLVGPVGFTVDTGLSTVDGRCTLLRNQTIFAVAPHMHKLGRHMSAQIGATMLMDRDYDFDEQTFQVLTAQAVAGDKIQTVCTYENAGAPVGFGESTDDEMCFLIVYRYPAGGQFSLCSG